jgi:hypothetical protein
MHLKLLRCDELAGKGKQLVEKWSPLDLFLRALCRRLSIVGEF